MKKLLIMITLILLTPRAHAVTFPSAADFDSFASMVTQLRALYATSETSGDWYAMAEAIDAKLHQFDAVIPRHELTAAMQSRLSPEAFGTFQMRLIAYDTWNALFDEAESESDYEESTNEED
jgi:uncharacterized protein YxeA